MPSSPRTAQIITGMPSVWMRTVKMIAAVATGLR